MSDPVGTAGAIQYYVNSSTFGGNSNVLQLDTSNNRLGINSASPSVVLDVREAADANTEMYLINPSQTTDGRTTSITFGKDNDSNDSGRLQYIAKTVQADRRIELNHHGITGQFSLLNGGNVGIGTSAPATMLDLAQGGAITLRGNQNAIQFRDSSDNLDFLVGQRSDIVADDFVFHSYGGDWIFNAGNVGIGTTSPTNKLSVVDNSIGKAVSANFGPTTIDGSTREGGIQLHGSAGSADKTWGIWNDADPILLRFEYLGTRGTAFDAGTDVLTLDYSGKVGIGTTAPAEKLTVRLGDNEVVEYQSAAQELFQFWKEGSTEEARMNIKHGGATKIHFRGNGVSYFDGGNVGIGTVSPTRPLTALVGTTKVANTGGALFSQALTSGTGGVLIGSDHNLGYIQGVAGDGSTTKDLMLQLEGGSVGIGTNSPPNKLTIDGGNVEIRNGYDLMIRPAGNGNDHRLTCLDTGGLDVVWGGAVSTSIMRWTNAGNVGIGTTSPTSPLHVESATNRLVDLYSTDTNAYIQLRDSADSFYISSDNTRGSLGGTSGQAATNLNIDLTSGNVGIGTTAPTQKLVVQDSTSTRTTLQIREDGTGDPSIWFTLAGNVTPFAMGVDNSSSDSFVIAGSYDLAASPRLTIDSAGNVGIGTSGPAEKLDVDGHIRIRGNNRSLYFDGDQALFKTTSSGTDFKFQNSAATTNVIFTNTGLVGIGTASPGEKLEVSGTIKCTTLKFADGTTLTSTPTATVLLRDLNPVAFNYDMSVAGALGIGTTTPAKKLVVYETDGSTEAYARVQHSGDVNSSFNLMNTSSDWSLVASSGADRLDFYEGGVGTQMSIKAGGNVGIGTTSPATTLDIHDSGGTGLRVLRGTVDLRLSDNASNGNVGTESNHNLYIRTNSTDRITITNTGLVGIGVGAPAGKLHIEQSSTTEPALRITDSGVASYDWTFPDTSTVKFSTNTSSTKDLIINNEGSGAMNLIVEDGKVGIGTTNPLTSLHIRKATDLGTNFRAAGLGSTAVLFDISNYHDGAIISMLESKHSANDSLPPATRIASKVTGNGSLLLFGTTNSYSGGINNTALTINSVGRIGINTETPSSNLDIYRSDTQTSNEVRLRRSDSPSTYCEWSYNSGTSIFGTVGSDHLSLKTNGAHRIYIHGSSGNVGIATTSPSYTLDVDGTIRCSSLMFQDGTAFSSVSGVGQKAIAVNIGNGSSNVVARARSVVDASYGGIKNGMVIVYYYWYYTYRCGNGTCGANHYQKSVYNVISGTWTHIFDF